MRIGIDVGGTNTDAVLMQGRAVVGWVKTPTTADVSQGITTALFELISQTPIEPAAVKAVLIGTTHFTNAIVERSQLAPTAVLRLGLPATASLPPMVDWPPDLRDSLGDHTYMLRGGHEFDGRVISALDEKAIASAAKEIRAKQIRHVAVSSVFSLVNPAHEKRAAELLRDKIPEVEVTLSHEIGSIGLLERENATILNCCLLELARRIITSLRTSFKKMQIVAPFYLSQNDGTLVKAEEAAKYPMLTLAGGPTNSMRGAAFLSGFSDALVADLGGTTTDVGMLLQGFPRPASTAVEVGGVRTNFRMPDLYSIGLGGGSLVRRSPLRIGPQSLGSELTQKSLVFGGQVLTATDIAVAAGLTDIGEPRHVNSLEPELVRQALDLIQEMVDDAVDRVKTTADPIPLLLVGGASILVPRKVAGVSETLRPPHYAVANAVGAAISQVGGEVERVFSLVESSLPEALEQIKSEAIAKALSAGAKPDTVEIVDIGEIPLAYLPSNVIRLRAKAVGELNWD